jgi:hypothetical protein
MALPAILAALPALAPLIDRVLSATIPDPAERARVAQQAASEVVATLAASDAQQVAVNQIEAASPHGFAALWRPAAGWVAVAGLAYDALLRPLAPWVLTVAGVSAPPLPALGDALWGLLFGMLGLGAMRSYDKIKGTDLRAEARK